MMIRPVQPLSPEFTGMTQFQPQSAFDLWVSRELKRSFDATLAEPVPEWLLRMVSTDDPAD